ncbi:MAG: DNA polymerase I [Patescibacteria group bacterium]|nr:DNA polymerase I [Patescibacteria group bacterium]
MTKKFVIIDGKSIFYRGFYAMPNLRTDQNIPTGGVYGFMIMALEVIKRLKPDFVAVAWDKPKTNIRRRLKLYPEYKAGRKPAPQEFYDQIPILHQFLDYLGWPLYEADDYEADDIMGSLAYQATKKGIQTILITSDLDLLQVVNDLVKVYILKKGLSHIEEYSLESFEQKHHIKVDQYLDLKALKGDNSDNIPGVSGIGEKTAIGLLQQYKTIDQIYENINLIPESIRSKLIAGKDMAYLSKKLAKIWLDAPIKLNLDEVNGSKLKPKQLLDLANKLQFRTIALKIAQLYPDTCLEESGVNQIGAFSKPLIKIDKNNIDNLIMRSRKNDIFIFSRSRQKHGVDPLYIFLSLGNEFYYFDLREKKYELFNDFFRESVSIIGYDLKNTQELILGLGIKTLPNIRHDILIVDFLLENVARGRSLSEIASSLVGIQCNWIDELDNDQLLDHASQILEIIRKIYEVQIDKIKKNLKFGKLLSEIELPIINVLSKMEKKGILLDVKSLSKFNDLITNKITYLEQTIYGFADQEFNIASPIQLSNILFSKDKLNISATNIKKTKTFYSTAANELLKIVDLHPIIPLILEYREVVKLKNTYAETLPKLVDSDSVIHTTYSLTSTQTGRLSSIEPNLQNIPIRTELGKEIRKSFVPRKEKLLISADYSQFELRIAAFLAKDQDLIEQFNNGLDVHAATAAKIYQREIEDITDQMRRAAKTINFGILYGMSIHGLTQATSMNFVQAKDFIEKYKQIRKPIFDYMENILRNVRKKGYAETYFGRRRYFNDINSANSVLRQAAERAAINMPIQGTEAELMKIAMIKLDDFLSTNYEDVKILLQIHDSVVIECPKNVIDDVQKDLKDIMEGSYDLPVKLKVDLKYGKNWGEL